MHETAHVNTRARYFTSALRVPENDRRSRCRFGSRFRGQAELWQLAALAETLARVWDEQVSRAWSLSKECVAPRFIRLWFTVVLRVQSASRMTKGYLNWDSLQVPESWVVAWDNTSRYTEKDSPAGLGGTGGRGRFVFSSSGDSIPVAGTQVVPRDGSLVSPLVSCVGAVAKNLSATVVFFLDRLPRGISVSPESLFHAGRLAELTSRAFASFSRAAAGPVHSRYVWPWRLEPGTAMQRRNPAADLRGAGKCDGWQGEDAGAFGRLSD
jgi:hypothetical protein